ncbi:MAG TPA: helix-turn-helix domain-containing protein [Patescibacteria group bacterium]|nr:helix-turn-helix domain-containing protein [Patescibacteria group bacterium]
MANSIEQQLISLGFSDYEAGIYLELVKQSPASATFLAKKLKLSRSTVYTAIERLVARGVVGVSYRNEVKQFIAEPPTVIEELLEQEQKKLDAKFKLLEGVVTHLQALNSQEALIPNIIFFEGKESLKKIYLSMLREAPKDSTMYIIRDEFVWQDDWKFVFEQEWNDRVRRWRSENNIATKMLVNDSKEERSHEAYYKTRTFLDYRFLSKEHSVHQFVVYVLADTVSILSMEKNNLVGIKITNRHMANNFEALFQGLWSK